MKRKLIDGPEMQLFPLNSSMQGKQSACTWFCCSPWGCSVPDCDNCPFDKDNVPEEYAGLISYPQYLECVGDYLIVG